MTDICATDLRFIGLISSRRDRNVQYEIVPGKPGLRCNMKELQERIS